MVDLVKLRKKAKQQEAKAEIQPSAPDGSLTAAAPDAGPGAAVSPPSVESRNRASAETRSESRQAPIAADRTEVSASASSKLDRFKQLAGTQREGLVHASAVLDEEQQIEVLTFAIAGEHYAAAIERVVEIIPTRAATRVPNAEASVRGIISLRGTIVTVMDARARLGHPRADSGPDSRIIVVERGSETLGFEVDRVLRVVKVEASAIEPHPVVHASEAREPIRGVFRQASALTILLDLDKLLA